MTHLEMESDFNPTIRNHLTTAFLKHLISDCVAITCFLKNGVKLSGVFTYMDDEGLTLSRDGVTQLIFRSAIASVMPQDAFSVRELLEGK